MEQKYRKKHKSYENPIYREMKAIVKFRDNHSCGICNQQKLNIEIHHINKKKEDNSPKNLLSICDKCHQILHDKKMKFNFTKKMEEKEDEKINNYYNFLILKFTK